MKPELNSIGHIKTPYLTIEECPNNIDPDGPLCQIVIGNDFKDGLLGLVPGQKILILYWFENTNRGATQQESNSSGAMVGTFALRSPHRPNPIGAAIVTIEKIEKELVFVKGLDCLNGTHLLDIKPAIMHELNS
jgi:tRNA-Thr(GGU) m(6)t(6)A37 methyltransferase TsaA